MTHISIVDDHEIFLKGLAGLLDQQTDLKVIRTFTDAGSFLNSLPLKTDILLLDLQLPGHQPDKILQ